VGVAEASRRFGHSRRVQMEFGDFLDKVGAGDEFVYLTAQTTQPDEEARPGLCAPPAEQLLLAGEAPLDVPLMGSLVLAQVNVWMGTSRTGASSGLHHDFHDNLYVLVRGSKRFRLYSPDSIEAMAVAGHPVIVHPNGRVCYDGDEHLAADGSWAEDDLPHDADAGERLDDDSEDDGDAALGDAADPPPGEVDDSDDDTALETALDAAIEGHGEADDYDDESTATTEGGAGVHVNDDGSGTPKNFSTLDQSSESFPADFLAATSVDVTLEPGDMMFLPCGWFHEVTSTDAEEGGGHLAVNYWYHPPDKLDGDHCMPYSSTFWLDDWRVRCKDDPVLQRLVDRGGHDMLRSSHECAS